MTACVFGNEAGLSGVPESNLTGEPSAAERAYQCLRSDILTGALPAGPLDLKLLGERLHMSVTPVREALARLNAERLVQLAPHQGYAIERPSARRLGHLYELSGALIDLGLAFAGNTTWANSEASEGTGRDLAYPYAISGLFRDIATAQGNLELTGHILALNDRLLPARRYEPHLFSGTSEESAALRSLWDCRRYDDLRLCLRRHHADRMSRADALAAFLAGQVAASE